RHRAEFLELVDHHIDVLFANEAELTALFETDDFDAAVREIRKLTSLAAVTRGAAGSVIITPQEVITVPAAPVARVVDTTGAGDLYAAGVLFGLTRGLPLPTCGAIGRLCAAEIISHMGARPEAALDKLVASAGLVPRVDGGATR